MDDLVSLVLQIPNLSITMKKKYDPGGYIIKETEL